MADIAESSGSSMGSRKEKPSSSGASGSKEVENVRKSSRLKQHAKFEKHMSMFVMHSRKAERRNRSSDSSSDENLIPEKVPKKLDKPEKHKDPKTPARPYKEDKKTPKKTIEIKTEITSSEDDEEEVMDPNDKDFSLSMLNLRRVGKEPPRNEKSSVQLNARGMPQRIRKKNRLFFDDNVVNTPIVKNKPRKQYISEKRPVNRLKLKLDRKDEEPTRLALPSEDSKEANSVRQKIGMKLRNLLKLPKAQRWVFFEWFYSNIDHVLFFGNNDFLMCLKETFGHLRTTVLSRTEWCIVRRLMGKPRRCSQNFFREERQTLEKRREIIRLIQQRKIKDATQCKDLPDRVPLQLSVNSRVTAKLRRPQAGLFTGKVDAVDPSNHTYRITFDRVGLGTHSIPDYEVLLDGEPDMFSISAMHKRYMSAKLNAMNAPPKVTRFPWVENEPKDLWADNITATKFPKQFYEMIVRICKILKEKRTKVKTLKEMNSDAEKMVTLGEDYPEEFQRRYAAIIVDLESLNISLNRYLTAVQKYCFELAPEACSSTMLAPSFIREKSITEAKGMIENYFKDKEPLKNKDLLQLVTELVALVIQVQNLTRVKASAQERQVLKQSIAKIKTMISPKNLQVFQNCVEVHLQYIETTVGQGNHLSPLLGGSSTKTDRQ